MVSRSKVSEKIRAVDLRVGRDFLDALERVVEYLVAESITRAQWNKRKTVRVADLAYPIGQLGEPEAPVNIKVSTEQVEEAPTQIRREVNIGRTGGILRVGPDRRGLSVGGAGVVETDRRPY